MLANLLYCSFEFWGENKKRIYEETEMTLNKTVIQDREFMLAFKKSFWDDSEYISEAIISDGGL